MTIALLAPVTDTPRRVDPRAAWLVTQAPVLTLPKLPAHHATLAQHLQMANAFLVQLEVTAVVAAQVNALLVRKATTRAALATRFALHVGMATHRPHLAPNLVLGVALASTRTLPRSTSAHHALLALTVLALWVSAWTVQLANTPTRMARASVQRVRLARIQALVAQVRAPNVPQVNTPPKGHLCAQIVQREVTVH
jgi:hypothetical protein